ncbi:protein kinase domain-containing protein [Legionella adelaidensis]|nr:hypothetical protein [Legionella adelaidensis]
MRFQLIDSATNIVVDTVEETEIYLASGGYGHVNELKGEHLSWVIKTERPLEEIRSMAGAKFVHSDSKYLADCTFSHECALFCQVYGKNSAFYYERTRDEPRKLIMAKMPGECLDNFAESITTEEDFINTVLAILYSIQNLHDLGIIHLDIKVDNLYVSRRQDGSLAVYPVDFGRAREIGMPTLAGYTEYMPPELKSSLPAAGWQDDYMLGELISYLYEYCLENSFEETMLLYGRNLPEFLDQLDKDNQWFKNEYKYSTDELIRLFEEYAARHNISVKVEKKPIDGFKSVWLEIMERREKTSMLKDFLYNALEPLKSQNATKHAEVTELIKKAMTLEEWVKIIEFLEDIETEQPPHKRRRTSTLGFFASENRSENSSLLEQIRETMPTWVLAQLPTESNPPVKSMGQ